MKMKRYETTASLAQDLGLSPEVGMIAEIKATMTKKIIREVEKVGITHQELSDLSGIPRSSVTGILTGSLQKVSIERLIRLAGAIRMNASINLKKVA